MKRPALFLATALILGLAGLTAAPTAEAGSRVSYSVTIGGGHHDHHAHHRHGWRSHKHARRHWRRMHRKMHRKWRRHMRYGHHHDHDYDDDYDDVRITHYYSYDYQAPPTPVYQMPPVSEPTYQPPVSTAPLPSTQATAPYCREFTRRVVIGGVEQEAYGTACQQEDGSWKMISR